ncbi:unnamed protein product [Cercopithifilaria johnstoni]|uniref:Uncharacterized protein n=1 Tax=Cercopithifilaria johnstoni TaxID=2874296 RepID=A0A8J2MAC6_9BILA|nr:unnamed protein product [Cercopithifilaria johnstoni]
MTATPHFLYATMTKLHHATAATNLHPNSTSISSKELSISSPVQDHDSDLCVEQQVTEMQNSPLTCRSLSSSGHDDSVSIKISSSNCRMMTNDCYSSDSHLSGTNNAHINNAKRRRKPDGNFFFSF